MNQPPNNNFRPDGSVDLMLVKMDRSKEFKQNIGALCTLMLELGAIEYACRGSRQRLNWAAQRYAKVSRLCGERMTAAQAREELERRYYAANHFTPTPEGCRDALRGLPIRDMLHLMPRLGLLSFEESREFVDIINDVFERVHAAEFEVARLKGGPDVD